MHAPQITQISPGQFDSVLINMMPEWSGLLPTLAFAKSLRDRGVRVIYGGYDSSFARDELFKNELSCFKTYIEREGFNYYFYNASKGYSHTLKEVKTLVRDQAVDLFLVDSIFQFQGLTIAKCGVPVAVLATNFLSTMNFGVPPFTSSMLPGPNGFPIVKVVYAWLLRYLEWNYKPWLSAPIRSSRRYIYNVRSLKQITNSVGLKCGFTEYGIRPRLPYNILCPKELDFPTVGEKNYLGLNVDLSRSEYDFNWDELSDGNPLIYCSLGSQSYRYFRQAAGTFLSLVVKSFLQREDYQLVLHIGRDRSVEEFAGLPARIKVCSWAPQLTILKRASAAITHGGLNTIQECIYSGVPMVVFPSVNDEPGNAARIVYHGLGVRGNLQRCSVQQLLSMIDEVIENQLYKDNIVRMRDQIVDRSTLTSGFKKLQALVI